MRVLRARKGLRSWGWGFGLILLAWVGQSLASAAPVLVNPSDLRRVEVTYRSKSVPIYCFRTTPGSARVRGLKMRFSSFRDQLRALKLPRDRAKIARARALLSLGRPACREVPTPTPTPAPSGNFDLQGDVTEQGRVVFGIPSGLPGNISMGRLVVQRYCTGCHGERLNYTFPVVREAIRRSPMLYDEEQIPNAELAHLIAYLNRFRM